jgi:HPt (histidine-containing phosphotransfer) domain-containing protein
MTEDPIIVRADSIAGRLMPSFLSRRVKDLASIDQELARNGFRVIERIGHNLKGVGRSYGFDGISDIGAAIEAAGQQQDVGAIRRHAEALAEYLRRVRVVPV